MNAHCERHLAVAAKCGAKRIKDYCEYRKGKCHIDGLPDCVFLRRVDGNEICAITTMGAFPFPRYWILDEK